LIERRWNKIKELNKTLLFLIKFIEQKRTTN
jgi:hypothetical protein